MMIKTFQCHLSTFSDIKSLQRLLKVRENMMIKTFSAIYLPLLTSNHCKGCLSSWQNVMIKTFQCHLSPFSDIKSLQGLLKLMTECDDKDISVPSISLK